MLGLMPLVTEPISGLVLTGAFFCILPCYLLVDVRGVLLSFRLEIMIFITVHRLPLAQRPLVELQSNFNL